MDLLNEATRHLVEGRVDEAEALCRLIPDTAPDQVGVHYLMALIANNRGDFAAALAQADMAIARNAGVAEVYIVKTWALIGLNDREGAIEAVRTAISMAPDIVGGADLLAQLESLGQAPA